MQEKINKKNIELTNCQMDNLYNYMIKDIEPLNYYLILKTMDIKIYKVYKELYFKVLCSKKMKLEKNY